MRTSGSSRRCGAGRNPRWFAGIGAAGLVLTAALSACGGGTAADAQVSAAAGSSAAPAATRPATIGSVLVLGDSISAGVGATETDLGYVGRAEAALGSSVSWNVQATPGATLEQVVDGADLPTTTDAVVLELGTNNWNHQDTETFAAAYQKRIEALRDRYPQALVVCLGPWQDLGEGRTTGYNTAVRASCEQVSGVYVQISDLTSPSANRSTEDDFHPSDQGAQLIADRLVPVLRGA